MKRVCRWLDANRREVAERYAQASANYRDYLRSLHERGTKEYREAWHETKALTVYGVRPREIQAWLGGFDSAKTLLEEYPQMSPFISTLSHPPVSDRRRVGGPPPAWMAYWLPLVSLHATDNLATTAFSLTDFASMLKIVYRKPIW